MSHSYGKQPQQSYPSMTQGAYYYPVPQQASMRTSPYGHPSNSAAIPPRPSTYPQPGNSPPIESERARKRQRPASMDHSSQVQTQWVAQYTQTHPQAYPHQQMLHPSGHSRRSPSSTSQSPRGSDGPEEEEEKFDHGPTELPPRTYSGQSKYNPPKKPGKIPGSAMDYLPILEARFDRLETAIDRYVDYRGQRALSNSILPGQEGSSYSMNKSGNRSRH